MTAAPRSILISDARRKSIRERMPPAPATGLLAELHDGWSRAFSLIEVMIITSMIGTIMAIGLPKYMEALDNARDAHAIGDLTAFASEISYFATEQGRYPVSLAEIRRGTELDPWGNPYYYGVIDSRGGRPAGGGGKKGGKGGGGGGGGYLARKDKWLHPVNADFDIYSAGKDGQTAVAFTAGISHDDIVRANNGGFYGRAEDF